MSNYIATILKIQISIYKNIYDMINRKAEICPIKITEIETVK
jgi:hypothetical protein